MSQQQGQEEGPSSESSPSVVTDRPAIKRTGFGGSIFNALSALENRDFRILWFGVGGHALTLWMEIVARNWLVWELSGGSLAAVGLINFWRTIPVLFLAIPAGVIADRFNRKAILLITQVGILVVYAVLLVMLMAGALDLWEAYALFFLRGVAIAFNQPPRQALIPALVKGHQVANAVALQQLLFNGTRIVSPVLTGLIFGAWGGVPVFGLIVFIEMLVIVAWLMLRIPPMTGRERTKETALQSTVGGLKYVAHHRNILIVLLLGLLSLLLLQPFMVVLPAIADEKFSIGPEGFGLFISMMGVGSVIGPLVLAFMGDFRAKGGMIVGTMAASGVALAGLGVAPILVMAMAIIIVIGLFDSSQRVITNGLLLTQTDREFHGRVVSLYLLDRGFVPIGSLVAGYAAESFGSSFALVAMGVGLTVSVLLVIALQPRFLSAR